MEEFSRMVECPHCGLDNYETFAFNFMEADPTGCDSKLQETECKGCFRKFWSTARVNFEVEIYNTYGKKPLKKGGANG